MKNLLPGRPYPLGAAWDGKGVNFAIFSEHAERVELCLFDSAEDVQESFRIALPERTDNIWHGYMRDIGPGQLYAYRVHGPYDPKGGLRFNPQKVLFDPYARAVGRPLRWADELFGYRIGDPAEDLSRDDRDNAAFAPLGAVIDNGFDWGNDKPPRTPWSDTVIYEAHVRGLTRAHPEVPQDLRGTYAGLAAPAVINHLRHLGVTAVELMPVHHFVDDRYLVRRGQSNYWGYNSLGYFAPDPRYVSARRSHDAVSEFKSMVKVLHAAGIEVILDVVYNHTAEGNHMGPTLSLRGIDNDAYYRLSDDLRYYADFTGCGNTLNMRHPRALQIIMDSLRYWATEMRVDGFRFDLAAALAREFHEVNRLGAFFDIIQQDPVLNQVKLIAEPWDLGEGGYQVGNFPTGWTEWNGKYRDAIRRYWKGDGGVMSELATRLCGSSDLYEHDGRRPWASINFVTAHDGFCLEDLVSYDRKHNEANGDGNRDGSDFNLSWNCGKEGPADDKAIVELRERQKRNFLATLFFSQGVPMILGGDELGRTQKGNNNAYCQDNDLTWHDWSLDERKRALLDFTARLIQFRRRHPTLRRGNFLEGRPIRGVKSIVWLRADGAEMSDAQWNSGWMRSMGVRLDGEGLAGRDLEGRRLSDDTMLLLFNSHHEAVRFALPEGRWSVAFDTNRPDLREGGRIEKGGGAIMLGPRSLQLLILK